MTGRDTLSPAWLSGLLKRNREVALKPQASADRRGSPQPAPRQPQRSARG